MRDLCRVTGLTRRLAAILAAFMVTVWAGAAGAAPIPVITRTVLPSDTDPNISDAYGQHFVAVGPAQLRNGKLLVFFPGTGGEAGQYSQFLRHAATNGYLVVGLAYRNDESINNDVCGDVPIQYRSQCKEDSRLEILLGADVVDSWWLNPDVSAADAAYHRLMAVVADQAAAHPAEGWGGFLADAQTPRWNLIAFAGHSQGGGHAAMTGKLNHVDRVLLFDATEPDDWTQNPGDTSRQRYWGLAHELESQYDPITQSWDKLGLPGALFNVDGQPPPFGDSHRLVSATDDCQGDPLQPGTWHGCLVVDEHLPTGSTLVHLKTVWNQILTG
jgi:hypothetical protein